MIFVLTKIGEIITVAIVMAAGIIYLSMRITWRCGMCGKINETGLFKFLTCMCDHGGDFN